jgi:hypothetical protein
MGLFRRKVPLHYIPVHRDNITKRDWIILLEAGTIVGPSAEKLRVALATLEKKIVTKYNIFLRPEHFLVLEGSGQRGLHVSLCERGGARGILRSGAR